MLFKLRLHDFSLLLAPAPLLHPPSSLGLQPVRLPPLPTHLPLCPVQPPRPAPPHMLLYVDNLNKREGKRTKKESRERRTQKTTECVPVAPPSPRPVSSCVWVPSRPVAPVVVLYFVLHPKGDDCRRRRARRKIKENVDTDLPEESS